MDEKHTKLPIPINDGDYSLVVEPPDYCLPTHHLWKYSKSYAERVCDYLLNGKSLTKICKIKGMPSYSTLCYWRSNNVDFDNMIKKSKQYRAEQFRDRIEEEIDEHLEKDEVAQAKLKFDKLKYLAAVDDQETYGKSTGNSSGDNNIQVVINTGINRNTQE